MSLASTPTPAPSICATGTWTQKFSCGWHQPTTGAAHAGAVAGHAAGPVVVTVAVIVLAILAFRVFRRSGKRITVAKP